MGISLRRTAGWLVMASLAIAAPALLAGGGVADAEAGAPPVAGCETGAGLADVAFTGPVNDPACVDGNVREGAPSCEALGFPAARFLDQSPAEGASDAYVTGTLVGDGLYLDITAGSNVRVLGAVIKGGNDSNVYTGDLEGLHSPLNNAGTIPAISHWTICYEVDETPPGSATVTVRKSFEGPAGWQFGFMISCRGPDGAETFVLAGGGSSAFEFDFSEQDPALLCVVAEEPLAGDWTVLTTLAGAVAHQSGSDATGTFVAFELEPDDTVTVTFENIAGYAAQPPSGAFPTSER